MHSVIGDSPYKFPAAPAAAIGILILPLFDTFRVFTTRILRGRSPFLPDRNHIHHLLIDTGISHMQATFILLIVNSVFIFLVVKLQPIGNMNLLIVVLGLASVLTTILYIISRARRNASVE